MIAAPASAEESAQIQQLLDGTSWYVHKYREGEAGGEKDAAEVFLFSLGGVEGPVAVTSQYREPFGNFSYSAARTQMYAMTVEGKNVMLRVPSLRDNKVAARSLRIDRWSAESIEMFDYDFTRTYTLRRILPGRAANAAPVGDYSWLRVAPDTDPKVVRLEATGCELRTPSEGKSVQGSCTAFAGGLVEIDCDVPPAASAPDALLDCHFRQHGTNWGGDAKLRLNPDGSLAGKWSAGGTSMTLVLFRFPK